MEREREDPVARPRDGRRTWCRYVQIQRAWSVGLRALLRALLRARSFAAAGSVGSSGALRPVRVMPVAEGGKRPGKRRRRGGPKGDGRKAPAQSSGAVAKPPQGPPPQCPAGKGGPGAAAWKNQKRLERREAALDKDRAALERREKALEARESVKNIKRFHGGNAQTPISWKLVSFE